MSNRSLAGATFPTGALFLVLIGGAAAPGCGASFADLCDEVCDCTGCSDEEHDDCVDNAEDTEKRAADEGCEDQLADYVDCASSELECRDGAVDFDGCEKEAEVLAGCGDGISIGVGNPCDTAAALCGGGTGSDQEVQCEGQTRCFADCINDRNSCDVSDPALNECIASCA